MVMTTQSSGERPSTWWPLTMRAGALTPVSRVVPFEPWRWAPSQLAGAQFFPNTGNLSTAFVVFVPNVGRFRHCVVWSEVLLRSGQNLVGV